MRSNLLLVVLAMVCALPVSAVTAQDRKQVRSFDKGTDLLLLQHDCKTDPDDIMAIATEAGMLTHPDFADVNYHLVLGSYHFGELDTKPYIPRSDEVMAFAFGVEGENWTNIHKDFDETEFVWPQATINRVAERVKRVLDQSGIVWVAEAGTSNYTAQWLLALRESGVDSEILRRHVVVVQHSKVNEDRTEPGNLQYTKQNASYFKIDDGNSSNRTPAYKDKTLSLIKIVTGADDRNNKNLAIWRLANEIIQAHPIPQKRIQFLDFSDTVEVWWILQLGSDGNSVQKVIDRYIVNLVAKSD
ncbi:hypothetical protein CA13_29750 [Planctomycetes bacterium CA13]|uniref:Uncharacterized protein n=1 Tax=Novipirellula herctigrandis TaxID=2527986 RepID=A0A5C5Z2B3_9BACT|nr:hypothetical protein CA13_29750 [Planctomycetes bacterium CA13]